MTTDLSVFAPFTPRPTPSTQEYWDNLAEGKVSARRCRSCRRWWHPPLERCRNCGGDTAFEPLSGVGTIYSFTVTHYPVTPFYESPFAVAVVEMDEQSDLRMVGRVIGIALGDIAIGMRVAAEIEDLPGSTYKVVAFLPAPSSTAPIETAP